MRETPVSLCDKKNSRQLLAEGVFEGRLRGWWWRVVVTVSPSSCKLRRVFGTWKPTTAYVCFPVIGNMYTRRLNYLEVQNIEVRSKSEQPRRSSWKVWATLICANNFCSLLHGSTCLHVLSLYSAGSQFYSLFIPELMGGKHIIRTNFVRARCCFGVAVPLFSRRQYTAFSTLWKHPSHTHDFFAFVFFLILPKSLLFMRWTISYKLTLKYTCV